MFIDVILSDENMISFDEFMDFDYKINSSDNNEILLGNASASSLNFSIWNDKSYSAFRFKNGTCFLYRDEERSKKIGEFNIDKITKDKNTLKFECTDYMTKFDDIFKGIAGNFTVFSLIVQMCAQIGITLRNTEDDFKHLTYKYSNADDFRGKKCRDIIKWIGEVACKYAIIDEDGQLYFNWYNLDNNAIKKEIPYSKLREFARDEEETLITGVSVLIDKEEEIVGSKSGYDLRLTTDNPLLKVLSIDERKAILQDIYNKIYGMNYLSCDIALSVDDEIAIGDTLKVVDEDGEVFKIIVSYLNINKIFSMKITSAGENLNRSIDQGSSSSGGGEQAEKTYIAKDETWKDINLKSFKGETFLNSISVFGVNEKSSAFISFNIEFESDIAEDIKFKFYINDKLTKEFTHKTIIGTNIFNWSEMANLKIDADVNVFKFTLDTSNLSTYNINILKEKSILSVISTGAKAGTNVITNLEFKEDIKPFMLFNETSKLIIRNIEDNINVFVDNYKTSNITEIINPISFKNRARMNIKNIDESLE